MIFIKLSDFKIKLLLRLVRNHAEGPIARQSQGGFKQSRRKLMLVVLLSIWAPIDTHVLQVLWCFEGVFEELIDYVSPFALRSLDHPLQVRLGPAHLK